MGLDFSTVEHRGLKPRQDGEVITRDPACATIEQLIAENERLHLLIVELLAKNEHLRSRLQDKESI
jgi:hypothetical protein